MRARTAAAAVVLLGGLLGGCQTAVPGSPGISAVDQQKVDRITEERAAVEAAITSIEQAPALLYTATVKDASGKPADQQFRITRRGSAVGMLPIDGRPVHLAIADGQLYLQADADYWKAHAVDQGAQFGTNWVRTIGTELPLDPAARLAPAKLAAGLRGAMVTMDPLAEPVKTKLPDGTEVYELGVAPSTLRVTTAKPNRVVSFAPALLDPQTGAKLGAEFRVEPIAVDALKKFHDDLDGTIGGITQPFDGLAQASAVVVSDNLNCQDFVGTCVTTADVSNSVVGGPPSGNTVHIVLNVEVSADGLGGQTCTTDGDAAPYATIKMSCSVKFKLPNKTASYQVLSKPTASAEVRAAVDAGAVKQKLQSEFAALGG
ncbi:MAG TPA: hypothetical protein VJX66_12310 [Amycolatopsis sp.]|nr:hypothetical protein [Amycolatopsis sp.]